MATSSTARYAIYYAPEPGSQLDSFGRTWLGGAKGNPLKTPGLDRERIAQLTQGISLYGFHGTLKPPFELNPVSSLAALIAAAKVFARGLRPVEIPPLELAVIGKFIALTPVVQSAALEKLAAACVRAFEAFRMPLSDEQVASYKQNKLTVHQEQMLEHWGYPYVMEEFRFHISLTDRIDDDAERDLVMKSLQTLTAPMLGKPIRVSDIVLYGQSGPDQQMTAIERIPFGPPP